ncbi:PilW family protein [Dyella japonica]|uniref:Pilus assembly protein PilW n=1 Tax=Dyella japonica A8 TaxID=1217721 RepID=A0A075JZ81_9GAMM|nr:PilW family protein [Dyella japonica]AIF47401.1 hypothetical protein HY57_09010 [Dyella japonica A8]
MTYPLACSERQCARGFTLVELLVGVVVSIICVLAMMAAFAAFEGPKRTATSGGDAQQNGSYSLFEMERQIRTAGSGFTQGYAYGLWGCTIAAYAGGNEVIPAARALPAPFNGWPQSSPATPVNLIVMPVLISAGGTDANGNAASDTLAVVSGNPAGTVFKGAVQATSTSSTLVLDNALGIASGDYLIGATTGGNCIMGKASTVTLSTNQMSLSANDGPSTGMTAATYVFDIGQQPVFSLYGVDTTTSSLVTYDMLRGDGLTTQPINEGIVAIKALYGVDDGTTTASIPGSGVAGDGIIDEWVKPSGTTWSISAIMASQTVAAQAYKQIKAIRLVVVSRSQLPEHSTDYTGGSTTLTLFKDLPAADQYTISTQTQYRYKIYDTTIPIRNSLITRLF